jgi:hypothetical protein
VLDLKGEIRDLSFSRKKGALLFWTLVQTFEFDWPVNFYPDG